MSKKAHGGGIHYWVAAETLEGGLTDVSKKAEFNVLHPSLSVVKGPRLTGAAAANYGRSQFFADLGKGYKSPTLTVVRKANYADEGGLGLMLVHSDNLSGGRHLRADRPDHQARHDDQGLGRDVGSPAERRSPCWPRSPGPSAGSAQPTGSVAFYDNGVLLSKKAVASGQARLSLPSLPRGVHVIGVALHRHAGRLADQQDLGAGHRRLATARPPRRDLACTGDRELLLGSMKLGRALEHVLIAAGRAMSSGLRGRLTFPSSEIRLSAA